MPHIHLACPTHVRNYLLAQAHVDAPALASSKVHLNTSATFSPLLKPLQEMNRCAIAYSTHRVARSAAAQSLFWHCTPRH
ncbi:hypothetical protein OG21DRAFT_1254162 [Imleria badia]|nr:hypothetical protein OG21DRAFT_1254162 [Imleria badia]